ncbi:Pol polyprotein, partial [Mucuna pruriens]
MPAPKTETKVRGFLGRINYISRFISQLIATCIPIFKLLRKNQKDGVESGLPRSLLENQTIPGEASRPHLGCTRERKSVGGVNGAAKRLRQYMLAHTTWLISKTDPINQKAIIKGSALAKHLAHHPIPDYHSLLHEFPDEHIMIVEETKSEPDGWRLWFDGASNLLGNEIGAVLASLKGQCFPFLARLRFDCTNNMAKYEACAMRIMMALEHQVKELKVFDDSTLVIYQLHGECEMRDAKLILYHNHVTEMSEHFDKITFHYVPRDKNQMDDALATLSAMLQVNEGQEMSIHIWHQSKITHCQHLDQDESETDDKPRYHDIKRYLKKGVYPEGVTENDKRTLRRLAFDFFLSGAICYKKSADFTLLHCVDDHEAKGIIKEVHEGTFGAHTNVLCLSSQNPQSRILLDQDGGLDIIGPIEPKASNGHRFILVVIDYFTKWVEAASYPNVTKSIVVKLIKRDIICRYGLPAHIITDNGTNLNNKMMTELCEQFKIKHHNYTPYRPKMNEVVEAANKK